MRNRLRCDGAEPLEERILLAATSPDGGAPSTEDTTESVTPILTDDAAEVASAEEAEGGEGGKPTKADEEALKELQKQEVEDFKSLEDTSKDQRDLDKDTLKERLKQDEDSFKENEDAGLNELSKKQFEESQKAEESALKTSIDEQKDELKEQEDSLKARQKEQKEALKNGTPLDEILGSPQTPPDGEVPVANGSTNDTQAAANVIPVASDESLSINKQLDEANTDAAAIQPSDANSSAESSDIGILTDGNTSSVAQPLATTNIEQTDEPDFVGEETLTSNGEPAEAAAASASNNGAAEFPPLPAPNGEDVTGPGASPTLPTATPSTNGDPSLLGSPAGLETPTGLDTVANLDSSPVASPTVQSISESSSPEPNDLASDQIANQRSVSPQLTQPSPSVATDDTPVASVVDNNANIDQASPPQSISADANSNASNEFASDSPGSFDMNQPTTGLASKAAASTANGDPNGFAGQAQTSLALTSQFSASNRSDRTSGGVSSSPNTPQAFDSTTLPSDFSARNQANQNVSSQPISNQGSGPGNPNFQNGNLPASPSSPIDALLSSATAGGQSASARGGELSTGGRSLGTPGAVAAGVLANVSDGETNESTNDSKLGFDKEAQATKRTGDDLREKVIQLNNEIGDQDNESESPSISDVRQKSEVGGPTDDSQDDRQSQRSNDKAQRSNDKAQRSNDKSQRSNDMSQRSSDKSQRFDDRERDAPPEQSNESPMSGEDVSKTKSLNEARPPVSIEQEIQEDRTKRGSSSQNRSESLLPPASKARSVKPATQRPGSISLDDAASNDAAAVSDSPVASLSAEKTTPKSTRASLEETSVGPESIANTETDISAESESESVANAKVPSFGEEARIVVDSKPAVSQTAFADRNQETSGPAKPAISADSPATEQIATSVNADRVTPDRVNPDRPISSVRETDSDDPFRVARSTTDSFRAQPTDSFLQRETRSMVSRATSNPVSKSAAGIAAKPAAAQTSIGNVTTSRDIAIADAPKDFVANSRSTTPTDNTAPIASEGIPSKDALVDSDIAQPGQNLIATIDSTAKDDRTVADTAIQSSLVSSVASTEKVNRSATTRQAEPASISSSVVAASEVQPIRSDSPAASFASTLLSRGGVNPLTTASLDSSVGAFGIQSPALSVSPRPMTLVSVAALPSQTIPKQPIDTIAMAALRPESLASTPVQWQRTAALSVDAEQLLAFANAEQIREGLAPPTESNNPFAWRVALQVDTEEPVLNHGEGILELNIDKEVAIPIDLEAIDEKKMVIDKRSADPSDETPQEDLDQDTHLPPAESPAGPPEPIEDPSNTDGVVVAKLSSVVMGLHARIKRRFTDHPRPEIPR